MKTTLEIEIEMPSTPNFIIVKGVHDIKTMPIELLSESDMRIYIKEYSDKLYDNYKARREVIKNGKG